MASAMPPPLVRSFIVLGPRDGAGLTPVSSALVRALRALGVRAVGMKPVARGRIGAGGTWLSEELRQLASASAFGLPLRALCGALRTQDSDAPPDLHTVVDTFRALATWADALVVDGADGASFDGLALARALQLPFVDVAGEGDDGVNARTLVRGGLECAGWLGERHAAMPGERLGRDAAHVSLHGQRMPKALELRA